MFVIGGVLASYAANAIDAEIEEASGIARLGDELLIVGDGQAGAYYRFPLGDDRGAAIGIDRTRVTRVDLPRGGLALDLEAVDVLADGRVLHTTELLPSTITRLPRSVDAAWKA